jgi:hypothetical protein
VLRSGARKGARRSEAGRGSGAGAGRPETEEGDGWSTWETRAEGWREDPEVRDRKRAAWRKPGGFSVSGPLVLRGVPFFRYKINVGRTRLVMSTSSNLRRE